VPWNHALLTGLWLAASTCAGAGAWSGARGAAGAPRGAHRRQPAPLSQVQLRPIVAGLWRAAAPGAAGACPGAFVGRVCLAAYLPAAWPLAYPLA